MTFLKRIRHGTFYQYLLSYISLFIIPVIIISSCSFIIYNKLFRNIAMEQCVSDINRISRNIEQHMDKMSGIRDALEINNNFRYQIRTGGEYDRYLIRDQLSTYMVGDDFIYKAFLYIEGIQDVFSNFNIDNRDYFNHRISIFHQWPMADFLHDLAYREGSFIVKTMYQEGTVSRPVDAVVFAYPIHNYMENARAMLIFVVLESTLIQLIANHNIDYENILLLTADGDILAASQPGTVNDALLLSAGQAIKSGQPQKLTTGREKYTIVSGSLTKWGWTCVSAVNESILFAPIRNLNYVFIAVLAFTCILAALLIRYMMKINYNPLKMLYHQLLSLNESQEPLQKQPVILRDFQNVLEDMHEELSVLQANMHHNNNAVQQFVLSNIINGAYGDHDQYLTHFPNGVPVAMNYRYFFVCITALQESQLTKTEEIQLSEWLNDGFGESITTYAYYGAPLFAVLFCSNRPLDENADARQLQDLIKGYCAEFVNIGVGTRTNSIAQVKDSYQKALIAFNHIPPQETGRIEFFSQLCVRYRDTMFMKKAEFVENALENEDWETAYDQLQVFVREQDRSAIPLFYLKTLVYKIANGALREWKRKTAGSGNLEQFSACIEVLIADRNVDSVLDALRAMIGSVRAELDAHSEQFSGGRMAEDAKDYIQANFADYTFSVANMSKVFNRSVSYIIRQFKQETGMSVMDYTNQIRTRKAKELIARSDKTLNEIAIEIGYSNASSFIRMFKKICGITPGKYKEKLRLSRKDGDDISPESAK